jgi:hypothetical protein
MGLMFYSRGTLFMRQHVYQEGHNAALLDLYDVAKRYLM